jgi:hypothetical protein
MIFLLCYANMASPAHLVDGASVANAGSSNIDHVLCRIYQMQQSCLV